MDTFYTGRFILFFILYDSTHLHPLAYHHKQAGMNRDEYYEIMAARCIFTEREQSDPEPQKARVDSVTIRHNEEKAGIEIIFPAKPEATVINRLKSMGFRWSRFQGLWWRRFDEAVMAELQASL